MTPSRTRKAALLLMGLDQVTAAELLKAARPEMVPQIAAELAYLDAAGPGDEEQPDQSAMEFLGLLHSSRDGHQGGTFVQRMLTNAVGERKSKEIFDEVQHLLEDRDPFLPIRSVDVESLAQALTGQHPQAAALVLMELSPTKSAQLIPLLDEAARGAALQRMTCGDQASPEARTRVAALVCKRLEALQEAGPGAAPVSKAKAEKETKQRLRRVALLLRNLDQELRDGLLQTIAQQDEQLSTTVQNLMVTWEDIPLITDRSLQDVLRNVDARSLALALADADPTVQEKVRSNISERAGAMMDEETSLMKSPKESEIEDAREEILGYLRQLNATGELRFEEA